jgi:hypothetical protein
MVTPGRGVVRMGARGFTSLPDATAPGAGRVQGFRVRAPGFVLFCQFLLESGEPLAVDVISGCLTPRVPEKRLAFIPVPCRYLALALAECLKPPDLGVIPRRATLQVLA